ncbi:MAG TPA: hypothetical protein VKV21_05930 [Solirubrobacteraceae bacterium]|nr:hypothetical protein [Solirubrobacteraceae bacterium]
MTDSEFEAEQEKEAAAEAARIGGRPSNEPPTEYERELTEADRPVIEAGEGEWEGFELSEYELEEHASHGDEHAARRIIEDASLYDEGETSERGAYGEGDAERDLDA